MTRTKDEYAKCPKCGADLEDNGGMFMAHMECTECDYDEWDSCGCVTG